MKTNGLVVSYSMMGLDDTEEGYSCINQLVAHERKAI